MERTRALTGLTSAKRKLPNIHIKNAMIHFDSFKDFILIYDCAKVWLLKKLYKCLDNNDMFCVWCMVCWFYESSKPQKLETRFIKLIKTTRWTLPNTANYQVPIFDPANPCCCFPILYKPCCECDILFEFKETVTIKNSAYDTFFTLYALITTTNLYTIKRAWKIEDECLRFILIICNGNFTFT